MKYFVAPGQSIKLAGKLYNEGEIVDIRGRMTADAYGTQIVPITDPVLLRNLDVNAHPYYALTAHRWGRVDYVEGDVIWVMFRGHAKLIADWTRPATGPEVMAWIARHEEAQAARKAGRPIRQALVATGGTALTDGKRGRGRPPGTGKNQKLLAARARQAATDEPPKRIRTAAE